jgi:formate dehydrogenase subunit delta
MSPEKLIRQANQIATFFRSRPHDEAVAGVAEHINRFWEPRMRRQLFEMVEAGGEGFHQLVLEAIPQIRPVPQEWMPEPPGDQEPQVGSGI